MKLIELKQIIDNTLKCNSTAADCEVTILISGESGIGARPSVKVRNAYKGIDWDSWQFMLCAEVPLYKKPQGNKMVKRKCFVCGTEMEEKETSINAGWGKYKVTIEGVKAHMCPKCGEKVFDSDEVGMIQNLCKNLSELEEKPELLNVKEMEENENIQKIGNIHDNPELLKEVSV